MIEDIPTSDPPIHSSPIISFKDVHKWYHDLHVLRGLTIDIYEGEVFVICGPSGSGKSTLVRCINRLEEIQQGEIIINGKSIYDKSEDLRQLRSSIGVVFQHFNLYPHLTAQQNVTLAPIHVRKWSKEKAKTRSMELLELVGLREKANIYPSKLSGGEQQRVAIARAMAMDPKIILFDEPTSALDPELIDEVLAVMRDLSHTGITMVIVSHEMNFAKNVANRITFMEHGVFSAVESPRMFFSDKMPQRVKDFIGQLH